MVNFEIRAKDGLARLGRFSTKHGTVKTPLLMPVIHPGKSIIPPKDMVGVFGFQMVITNSYIINSHEKFRKKEIVTGLSHDEGQQFDKLKRDKELAQYMSLVIVDSGNEDQITGLNDYTGVLDLEECELCETTSPVVSDLCLNCATEALAKPNKPSKSK